MSEQIGVFWFYACFGLLSVTVTISMLWYSEATDYKKEILRLYNENVALRNIVVNDLVVDPNHDTFSAAELTESTKVKPSK